MRNKTLRELDGVAGGKVRPFGAIESGELGEVFKMDSRRCRLLKQWLPCLGAWCVRVLEFFQLPGDRETHEDNFAAAGAEFLDGCNRVAKACANRFFYLRAKYFHRDKRWRGRGSEQRRPTILHSILQTAGPGALFEHAGAPIAVDR